MLAPPGAAAGSPKELLLRHGLIRYDPALTGGRIASHYVRRVCPEARRVRKVLLGKAAPARQIAFVRRYPDTDNRNLDAAYRALAEAYRQLSS
jgi:hypothetical protein